MLYSRLLSIQNRLIYIGGELKVNDLEIFTIGGKKDYL